MIKIKLFFKILLAGFIGELLVVLLLNSINMSVLKPYEKIEIIIGITGLFTTFLGAYIGAKIAGSESRKLFKQQIKMNDLQQNMNSNLFVLEKIEIIPTYIDEINILLNKPYALHPNNIESIKNKYNQILNILNEVKEQHLSKTSIIIYRDVMNFSNKVQNSKNLFLVPINNSDTENFVTNILNIDLSNNFMCSWYSSNFNEQNNWKIYIRESPQDIIGKEVLIPLEKVIGYNQAFFDEKIKSLKERTKALNQEFENMVYKSNDGLINDYSKLYQD